MEHAEQVRYAPPVAGRCAQITLALGYELFGYVVVCVHAHTLVTPRVEPNTFRMG
jgi:hypothetical protein